LCPLTSRGARLRRSELLHRELLQASFRWMVFVLYCIPGSVLVLIPIVLYLEAQALVERQGGGDVRVPKAEKRKKPRVGEKMQDVHTVRKAGHAAES